MAADNTLFTIPEGYALDTLAGFKGKIIRPKEWSSEQYGIETTYIYRTSDVDLERQGEFETGFTLNLIFFVERKTGIRPSNYAQHYLEDNAETGNVMIREQPKIQYNTNGLIIRGGIVMDKQMVIANHPCYCRLAITTYAIDAIDFLALMTFGCPVWRWAEVENIYATICSKIVLLGEDCSLAR